VRAETPTASDGDYKIKDTGDDALKPALEKICVIETMSII